MSYTSHITVTLDGDAATITGAGTLDLTNYQEFHDGLKAASQAASSITVDLLEAEFIDTAVVQDLAKAAVTLINRGKRLKVLVTQVAYPYRVLQISGLQEIMDVEVEMAHNDGK